MKEGVSVRVKVEAGARKEMLVQKGEHAFEIAVREKAERNEANERVRELIARRFLVNVSAVRISSGHRRKNKILSVVL